MGAAGRLLLAAIGILLVLSLISTTTVTTTTEILPAQGGTYREALVGQPGLLNPLAVAANQCDSDIAALVFSGLTRRDEYGHIAPDIAEQWEISPDARVYTFTLNLNRRWHDGTLVTADDVVYTVRAFQSEEFPIVPWLADVWRGVMVEKLSDRLVRLTLPQPYAPFLQYTTVGLLPAHLLASGRESDRAAYDTVAVGSGPYRVVERTHQHTILEAFADYPWPTPFIPRLEFRYYQDLPAAIAALKNGDVMAVADIPLDQAIQLEQTTNLTVYWAPRASQTFVLFNLRLPYFENAQVRRALAMAVDRQALVQNVLHGKAQASDGLLRPSAWSTSSTAQLPAYNQHAARELLDKAGWRDSDGDGVREYNGIKMEFSLLTNDDPTRIAVALAVGQAWADIGAAVEVHVINSYALVQDYLQPRRFEAVLFGFAGLPDDPDPYEMWHSSQREGSGLNFTGFASHKADELLEEARRTNDISRRQTLYRQFLDILTDQMPGFPLYSPFFPFVASDILHRVRLSFITEPGDRFRHINEWYILTHTITITERHRLP